jgi:cellulose biosynthesis protein BcsQ
VGGMQFIQMIIADPDEEYIQYFTEYIRHSEFNKNVVILSFSKYEKFQQYTIPNDESGILLIHSDWALKNKIQTSHYDVILLSDSNLLKQKEESIPYVFKYQPLNQLVTKLFSIYYEGCKSKTSIFNPLHSKVISIFSSTGGCGKTTVAMNLVRQLNARHKKVFYLNLESISSAELFIHMPDEDQFAQILYYAKTQANVLPQKLDEFIIHNTDIGCDYIHPLSNYKDVDDIEQQDIETLIQSLLERSHYDFIVIDLDSTLHPKNWGSFLKSDYIVWLLSDDIQCRLKTNKIWKGLTDLYAMKPVEFLSKTYFTINKFVGTLINDFAEIGIKVSFHLPYIPGWKAVNNGEQLVTSDIFNRHINQLYMEMTGVGDEVLQDVN